MTFFAGPFLTARQIIFETILQKNERMGDLTLNIANLARRLLKKGEHEQKQSCRGDSSNSGKNNHPEKIFLGNYKKHPRKE